MANNRITIQAEFGQSYKDLGFVGRVGENDSREIAFDCADALAQFPGASIVCVIKRACDTKPYSAALTVDESSRILPLSAIENAVSGQIMIELRVVSNDTVLKSAMFSGRIAESLQGEGDRPGNPVRDVLDRVDSTLQSATETQKKLLTALDGVDTAVDGANTAAKNAQAVADTVQAKLDNGDFVGPAGKPGAPGSDASVTADSIQAALGYAPVKDVQLNGESLVQDSVATIPLAGYNRLGAIQLDPAGFAAASIEGKLALVPPTDAQISTHTHTQRPITPSCMDYALKAAMCDGKGEAWTEAEQKAARERMGVDKPYELIEEITLTEKVMWINRNAEPDGTGYAFEAVVVKMHRTNTGTGSIVVFSGSKDLCWSGISEVGQYYACETFLQHGYWQHYRYGPTDSSNSYPNIIPNGHKYFLVNAENTNKYIDRIAISSDTAGFDTGTTISIYGVRA